MQYLGATEAEQHKQKLRRENLEYDQAVLDALPREWSDPIKQLVLTSLGPLHPWTAFVVGPAAAGGLQFEVGGCDIDRRYGDWLDVWTQLTSKNGKPPVGQQQQRTATPQELAHTELLLLAFFASDPFVYNKMHPRC